MNMEFSVEGAKADVGIKTTSCKDDRIWFIVRYLDLLRGWHHVEVLEGLILWGHCGVWLNKC
jgi:hypothetical protein